MAPFDGSGIPPQGQPGVVGQPMQRGPMPPGHVPGNPSPVMPHQHPMNPAYGHQHRGGGMPGQPPYHPGSMPSQSPGRPGSFNGMPGGQGYGAHHAMHSPHQSVQGPPHMQPPMQRPGQQMHRGSMGPQHGGMMGQTGMPPPPSMQQHHDMRVQGGMPPNQQHYMQQQQQQQQTSQRSTSSQNVLAGNWQSESDTPHRRDMIQHMYVFVHSRPQIQHCLWYN